MLKIKKTHFWTIGLKKKIYLRVNDVNVNTVNGVAVIIHWLLSVGYSGNKKRHFVIYWKNLLPMARYDMTDTVPFIFIFCSVEF